MKRKLTFSSNSFFVLAIAACCSTCAKEYSYEGGTPTQNVPPPVVGQPDSAQFTLTGSPGYCDNFTVKGTYEANKILSNQNAVEVSVTVSKPGLFSLQTDTANGIYFKNSGTFTALGPQVVTLNGVGKPNLPGLFLFTPQTATSQCQFEVPVQNPEPLATYVLQYGPGTPNPCQCSVTGNFQAQKPVSGSNAIELTVFVTLNGNYTIQTNRTNGMYFSHTGNFTSTGQQTVTLTAYGTPIDKGDFLYYAQIVGPQPLGGGACGVNIHVQ